MTARHLDRPSAGGPPLTASAVLVVAAALTAATAAPLRLGLGAALLMASPLLLVVVVLAGLAVASHRRGRRQDAAATWAEKLRDTTELPAADTGGQAAPRTAAMPTAVTTADGATVYTYPPPPVGSTPGGRHRPRR